MRLNRLDLTRYGKFTDCSIDFGVPVPGRPDLHIVYGPNEAGKSTALAAFLDLLFGIETRSRFNFLHPYTAMQIGGSVELGAAPHELIRIKRAQSSLLDGNGLPIAEALLAGQLGNIDRDSYRAMFSLDDDTLEAGGEGAGRPRWSRQVCRPASNQRPSSRQRIRAPCGRPQRSHTPPARANRTRRLSSFQCGG